MSKTTAEIPFQELVERAAQIVRSENEPRRVRGAVNDVAARELPGKEDWIFLLASSAISATAEYKVGTCSVNTQATAATFSSDVVLTAGFTGRKIKFTGNPNVYDLTFANATGGTLNPPLSGETNLSSVGYVIFQPAYALASDFDRFPKNGGLLRYEGGRPTPVPEVTIQGYYDDASASPGTPDRCRLVTVGTAGVQHVELIPPPADPLVLSYEYFKQLRPMRTSTAGVASISASGTAVTGSAGTTRFTEASTGWYFRIDAFGTGEDSEWYRIIAIANDSALTLQTTFGTTGASAARYTLSPAPAMPAKMHTAILYGAVNRLLTDQNDPNYQFYVLKAAEALADAKRLYKSRIYQEHVESAMEDWDYRR